MMINTRVTSVQTRYQEMVQAEFNFMRVHYYATAKVQLESLLSEVLLKIRTAKDWWLDGYISKEVWEDAFEFLGGYRDLLVAMDAILDASCFEFTNTHVD